MRMTSVLLMVLLYSLTLPGQDQEEVEKLKGSVVKITSKAPEGQPRTGTGFIVRVDGEIIYIATASHVVEGDQKPQVAFYQDQLRPVAAEIGALESDNPTTGLGYVIVRDAAIARRVEALGWSTETLRGGEAIMTIGFGQGAGPWGVVRGAVASVSGADIRIDGRIEQGNSGGPLLMKGRVVGMVTASGTYGIAKSAIIVQATLRGWNVEISAPSGNSPTPRVAWDAHIRNGDGFAVRFDALEQARGTIRPGATYDVSFLPVERAWKASGPMHPQGSQNVTVPAADVCDPANYDLCIWGAAFRFDEGGQVFRQSLRVGRVP